MMPPIVVALMAYVAGAAVGMVAGSFMPFWSSVVPVFAASVLAGVVTFIVVDRRSLDISGGEADRAANAVTWGGTWGALAGSFAASTCGPTHGYMWSGSHVSALVTGLVALALAVIADILPRSVASRPHALCGVLFLSTVGLALALGAEVPVWPPCQ